MHVVHLEDDDPLREILGISFRTASPNLNMQQFSDSDVALKYIEEHIDEIDLFVLDVRVQGSMDGFGVARRIRELNQTAVIVLTSAYTTPSREVLNELGCEWFPKPWHIMETTRKLFEMARKQHNLD